MKDRIETLKEVINECRKETGEGMFEAVVALFSRDYGDGIIAIKSIVKGIISVPDRLFWNNFTSFLEGLNYNEENLRKLSALLSENGTGQRDAERIIKSINDANSKSKARYIGCLTEALIQKQIAIELYFRLINTINNLTDEDLNYLSKNIDDRIIDINDERVEEFMNNSLVRNNDGELIYTKKAYDLVEFALIWPYGVNRPKEIPGLFIPESPKWNNI